ncbi:MAG: hypothetical protein M3345_02845 [Actinomycetota bacterium]|nr:hypothetical protein [Actinomycetota bacterium]
MEPRAQKMAKNEALFRDLNERIKRAMGSTMLPHEKQQFICECGREDCFEEIELTFSEYESLRQNPRHFAVLRDHDAPEIEKVVATYQAYIVVEKIGVGAEIVEELDPRS